ncbi:organic cation transporter protein-like [Pectinophora gossypiella]|uniref:organic cation transporter protein-like n=1 Tax=Pectinophora gossypiella TaxID=13191 RepID=UPI00214E97DC|nr:organic cation transporter protein-like [Pectinophora gossypiella]XP_049871410.1 organic cation transporter protein-like [Pectinophora gossypiella]
MTKDTAIALDSILEQLGPFGRYNIVNYALLLFPIFLAGMFGSVYVFEAPDIGYRCKINECETLNDTKWTYYAIPPEKEVLSKCRRYRFAENTSEITCSAKDFNTAVVDKCSSFVYDDEDSAVRDFDLGCQNWKRTLIGTVHNAGLFVSLPLTGILSDKYGRRVALAVASLMNGIFGFIRSFSTSYVMMLVFEFLEAGLGAGAYSTAFVIAMELVGPKGRVFGNTLINAVYVMGLMTLAGLSWKLQSWRTLLRIIYTPALLVISYLWILNESVRWLISKGRHHDAANILKKAAKMNNVDLSEDVLSPLYELEKKAIAEPDEKEKEIAPSEEKVQQKETSTFRDVIKSSIIRKRVFVCSFLWITCTFVYYGLSINSVSLAGNKYVNFMLVAFVEIPANFMCLLVLDRFGRKKPLIITYILSACLCISLSFVPKDHKLWSLILYLSGKFSITVAYSSVYIYVSEVFPTSVRQSLLAVCSSLGRIGSTLAPLTPLLALYYDNLPAIFFGCLALIASLMVFTLPETINVPLPDTVEEAERLSRTKDHKQYA